MFPARLDLELLVRVIVTEHLAMHPVTVRRSLRRRLPRGEFFSLGGLVAPYLKTRTSFAPWTLSAAFLLTLGVWDPLIKGGRFDAILLGLAAYELLIGLTRTETPEAAPAVERVRRD